MNRIALLILIAAALGLLAPPAPAKETPPVEVFFVPREDLGRAPGYTAEGVFLPLDQVLALIGEANRRQAARPPEKALTCKSIELAGELDRDLLLQGEIAFDAPWEGWAAVRIDNGKVPWTAQGTPNDPPAFLVGIDRATYLIARGPGAGALHVEAQYSFNADSPDAMVAIGAFHSPTRISIKTSEHWRAIESDAPSREEGDVLVVSPLPDEDLMLFPQRRPPLREADAILQHIDRTVRAIGSGLEVVDEVSFASQFEEGADLEFELPQGLELLEMSTSGPARAARMGNIHVTLRALSATDELRVTLRYSASMTGDAYTLPPFPSIGEEVTSTVRMRGSDDWIPSLTQDVPQLSFMQGTAGDRLYSCWGALPELQVALLPKHVDTPPQVIGLVRIDRNEANSVFTISGISSDRQELLFRCHPDWIVTEVGGSQQGHFYEQYYTQRRADGHWTIKWEFATAPKYIQVKLHHAGSWGAPGTTNQMEFPYLSLEGERPSTYELGVESDETLELQPTSLEDLTVIPVGELSDAWNQTVALEIARVQTQQGELPYPRVDLAMRATGSHPKGSLEIRGRSSETRATVVTALSIQEDRTFVRTQVKYDVRYAPQDRFQVILPKGISSAVKVDGPEIRETVRETVPEGELFTLTTRHSVLGQFAATFEWAVDRSSTDASVDAPEIRVVDATYQQGFILLEASEALKLTAEAKNLAETDLAEVPDNPWQEGNRILAAYRYVEPPYSLRIETEKFQPEELLSGLVREANLQTTVSEYGERLTLAEYRLLPMAEQQFLEVDLPLDAQVWSVLVNRKGERPARRNRADGTSVLLVPLPTRRTSGSDVQISILYRQPGQPLDAASNLDLAAPSLPVPVNKTTWQLNLPYGFEYLSFQGSFVDLINVREPFVTFLRKAYYPSRLVFLNASRVSLIISMAILALFVFVGVIAVRKFREARQNREPKEPAVSASGCGVRLIEWLIIGAIVAILAAISVPNFMEAQVRSKVSRVKSDARSMATAIESYFVDNNGYPYNSEILWQGPVKYMTSSFVDPYNLKPGESLKYLQGFEAVRSAVQAGMVLPQQPPNSFWLVYSVGPDNRDDRAQLQYDPTNGTVSAGDIIRIAESNWNPSYGRHQQAQQSAGNVIDIQTHVDRDGRTVVSRVKSAERSPAPTEEYRWGFEGDSISQQEEQRVQSNYYSDPFSTPAEFADRELREAEEAMAGIDVNRVDSGAASPFGASSSASGPSVDEIPTVIMTDKMTEDTFDFSTDAEQNRLRFQDALVLQGEGSPGASPGASNLTYLFGQDGSRSRDGAIATTATDARQAGLLSLAIEIPEGGYQRQFEGLTGDASMRVRLLDQHSFQRLRFAVWLLVALALGAVWIAARQYYLHAIVLTLAVAFFGPLIVATPWVAFYNAALQGALFSLLAPLLARVIHYTGHAPKAKAVAVGALLLALAPLQGTHAEEPVRLIAPYDEGLPQPGENPNVFVDRVMFEELWNAAHASTESLPDKHPPAFIASWKLVGTWLPERSVVEGTLTLHALNTGDGPSLTPVAFDQLAFSELQSTPPGATLQMEDEKPMLLLPPHWTGIVEASFEAPCDSQGTSGRLEFQAPASGTGFWQISIPFANATADSSHPVIIERKGETSLLRGSASEGPQTIAWSAEGGPSVREQASDWRAEIETDITWQHLAYAQAWQLLRLSATSDAGTLPGEVSLNVGPLRIMDVAGPAVESAVIDGDILRIRLRETREANIVLQSVLPAPQGDWRVGGIGVGGGTTSRHIVRFNFDGGIEIREMSPVGLDRQAARGARSGFSTQQYRTTASDWNATIKLARLPEVFDANVTELFVPEEGRLRHAATLQIQPRGTAIRTLSLELPPETRVEELSGDQYTDWIWNNGRLQVFLSPAVENPTTIQFLASIPLEGTASTLHVQPLRIASEGDVKQNIAIVLSPDVELKEVDLAGATAEPPNPLHTGLLAKYFGSEWDPFAPGPQEPQMQMQQNAMPPVSRRGPNLRLRAYELARPAEMTFELTRIDAAALVTIFNQVTVSDGVQSLSAVLRAEPRRGRMRQVEAVLALPESNAAAASRLQVDGPIRSFRTQDEGNGRVRVIAELDAPYSRQVQLNVQLYQSADTAAGSEVVPTVLLPADQSGSRALLLLRREFEGELNPTDRAGARSIEPTAVQWPSSMRPLPSDQVYELDQTRPTFKIVRHAQGETLRAVVEVLRQRTIVTQDGFERHELELVLQNQSEQFLRVALPYSRDEISVYEVRVAGKTVSPTFGKEAGRDVLLIPLIRTGILDPELNARVAYAAKTDSLESSGKREQKLPEVLGGVPVLQSAMILMMPTTYKFKQFEGSLNRVDLVDLEVDEALRQARRAENLSEVALRSEGETLEKALSSLKSVQSKATSQYNYAMSTSEAYDRRGVAKKGKEVDLGMKLQQERAQNLQRANEAQIQLYSNVQRLMQADEDVAVQQLAGEIRNQAIQAPTVAPRVEAAQVDFPREGDVFVFRQIQGTGAIQFEYASRQSTGKRNDFLLATAFVALLVSALAAGKKVVTSRRRVGITLIVVGIVAYALAVAIDLAILAAVVGVLMILLGRSPRDAEEEIA
ncbi:prepilin-type N-terminal cleavage/methylation domain-containing protein [bacterium]|nr:prepilin-type N-terminal cleavage/methylation domain-containing protein [bacterium]